MNMTRQRVSLALLAVALGLAPASSVLAEGWYFGISGGLATVDLPSKAEFDAAQVPELAQRIAPQGLTIVDAVSSLDDNDQAWGVQVGYRWNRYVAAEAGYVNFGEALYDADVTVTDGVDSFPVEESVRFRSSGPTIAVLGMIPLGERFDLHGRAGVYFADTRVRDRTHDEELDVNAFHEEFDASSSDLFFGIGGTWNINESFSARIEYQRFLDVGDEDHTGESDIDLITVGILFR